MGRTVIIELNRIGTIIGMVALIAVLVLLYTASRGIGLLSNKESSFKGGSDQQSSKIDCQATYYRDSVSGREFLTVFKDDYTIAVLSREPGGDWK